MDRMIFYRKVLIDGLEIFYRETGSEDQPVLLLLHGFPSSSHMYRDLIRDLAGSYRIIAPDYPGFGQSSAAALSGFGYTFENISIVIEKFIDRLGLRNLHLCMQDYGGPVGFRIANRRPELIRSLIIQNANAYVAGFGPATAGLVAYIENPDGQHEQAARFFLTLEATRYQYLHGASDETRINPDSYITDQYYLDRPGNDQIQLALFRDYGANVDLYEQWQQYFRRHLPPALVVWGSNDEMFTSAGADAYRQDLPDASIVKLDGGHFLLEEHHQQVAALIRDFIERQDLPGPAA